MPICPKCHEPITSLNEYDLVWKGWRLTVEDGLEHYEDLDQESEATAHEIQCPECQAILFGDAEVAIKFLKGE